METRARMTPAPRVGHRACTRDRCQEGPGRGCLVRRAFTVTALNALADDCATPTAVREALDALARYAARADIVDALNVLDAVRLAMIDTERAVAALLDEKEATR